MDQRNPVCPSLWGILLFFIWTIGYVDPVTTSTNPTSTWTFSKDQSYLAFSPNLTLEQDQQIILSFRTRSPNGLLFCHLLEHFNQSFHPLLENYHFCAELSHGYLQVKYNLNQNSDVIKLGRALNDDSWHTVDIFLNTKTGELQVSFDDFLTTSRYLRAYTQYLDIKSILDWTRLKSVVSFAGLSPSVSIEYHQFIGCLQSLKYRELIEVTWEVSPSIIMQAESGCRDLCQEENPCGEGRCINLYTSVHCDCFSLDREGEKCQDTTVTEITLHGYEWLTYQLYTEEDRTLRDRNRFSLQFKSDRGSGVLLYAVGSTDMSDNRMEQHHSHLIASVHQGKVKASVAFGDDILEQTMGLGVDDNRWHNLTIVHEKVKVEFYLDGTPYIHETVNDMYYLGLDPHIYIGGGESFVQTLGLQVRQNFAGCLKNIFVNDHSILYELRSNFSTSQLHGNTEIQYGCHRVDNIPLTFPRSRSILFLSGYYGSTFSIQLEFRTVREMAILLSTDIQTIDSYGYPVKGYFEVWINGSLPMLKFVRSMYQNTAANTSLLPVNVSNNKWHTLSFNLKQGQVKISVDNLSLPSLFIGNDSQIYNNIEIGYGHRIYEDFIGFVGCIRNIVIQGHFLDPINLMESAPSGGFHRGLILDGCHLVDHCRTHQHCRNGGRCLSDWDGVTCDCSSSAYQGKYCQFARYRSSCDSYYQSGWRSSGVYVIDVDGSGPVEPTYVTCQMGISTDGDYYGQTVVEHNLSNQTIVRGTTLPDLMIRLTYREMGFVELQKLTKMSAWCEQYVQYTCLNAPIGLGNLTSFKSVDGTVVQYIGDVDQTLSPGCNKRLCNCDSEDLVTREDSGYNRITSQLPIKEITVYQFTDFKTPDSKGFLTIGPLKCWGNKESLTLSAVTFVTEDSFLQLPGWVYGDMEFSFRTHQTSALLMYQSSFSGDWFKVTLDLEDSIRIEIYIKENLILSETLDADKSLNDGDWHRVTLELSSHEVRCGLDSKRKIVSIPFHSNITFDGYLYLGGKMYSSESYENLPGLTGCVKGLVYNGRPRNLIHDVYDDMLGIQSGCRPHCSPDPCQNGGHCVEKWNDYQCTCTNKWAHSGHSCEININENVVTITGEQAAYFDLRISSNPLEMENRIIFSFHTQVREALIFYMYDELNNFIQLEVVEGKKLRFSRNNFRQIFYTDIEVPGITEPTWKQVVLDPSKINIDGKITYLNLANNKLESGYSSNPFANEVETVKPTRMKEKQPPFLRIYLGGTPANVTELDKFQGCMRGFKIGDRLIDLQKNSESNTGLKKGCKAGCTKNWCLNGGYCIERWGDGDYECDCSRSKFAGERCQLEASGIFSGQSGVHYHFTPSGQAARTNTEQFSFIFKTNCTEGKTMVLLLIFSKERKDYIVISLSNKFVRALLKQGNNLFEEKLKGSFCDGTAHKFEYKRENEEMWIRVDRSPWRKKFTTSTQLEDMDTLLVGGLIPSLTEMMEPKYGNPNLTVNFTGCISDVNYKPVRGDSFEVQPLKQLRDLKNGSLTVYGPQVPQCSPVDYDDHSVTTTSTVNVPTTTANPLSGITMPPWDVGSPNFYIIGIGNNGTTPLPPTTTTSTATTTAVVTTAVYLLTTDEEPRNITLLVGKITTENVSSMTILIVSTLVALLCLIAILIAIVMRRMRTRYVTYDVRKKYFDDFELKEPLNHTMETYSPAPPPPKKDIHIATWDEFSMVSATLGSSKKKQNGILPGKVNTLPADVRNLEYPVQTTFLPDDSTKYPVYNRKKNRPASSISEVLEEMERQQRAKELGADPDQYEEPKSHGEGDLEWDPLVDHTPLTMTQDEDSDGKSRATSCESEDPLKVLEQQQDLLHEYNADSGYEAESQRNGDDDLDLNESLTPPTPDSSKLYYDITGVEGSPQCTSTPHKIIVESEEQFV